MFFRFKKRKENIYRIIKGCNIIQLENFIKKNGISLKHGSFLEINDSNIINSLIEIRASEKTVLSVITTIKMVRKTLEDLIKEKDIKKFQSFIKNGCRHSHDRSGHGFDVKEVKELNSKDFDILLCALQNKASLEFVQFILQEVEYKTMDYFIETEKLHQFLERTPLYYALAYQNFEVADVLIENKAKVNYDGNDNKEDVLHPNHPNDPNHHHQHHPSLRNDGILCQLLKDRYLNHENLIYLIHHGVSKFQITHFIKLLIIESHTTACASACACNSACTCTYTNPNHYNEIGDIDSLDNLSSIDDIDDLDGTVSCIGKKDQESSFTHLKNTEKLVYTKEELIHFLKVVFQYWAFDNCFILNMLHIYKNGMALSDQQIRDIWSNKKSRIRIKDEYYRMVQNYQAHEFLTVLLENELRDKNYILENVLKS